MNKTELIKAVAKKTQYEEKVVREVVEVVTDTVMRQIAKGKSVWIYGFGTFSKRRRASRAYKGFDGKVVKKKATSIPYFEAGEVFKKVVRKGKK